MREWRGVILVVATIGALVWIVTRVGQENHELVILVAGALCTALGNLIVRSRGSAMSDSGDGGGLTGWSAPPAAMPGNRFSIRVPKESLSPPIDPTAK